MGKEQGKIKIICSSEYEAALKIKAICFSRRLNDGEGCHLVGKSLLTIHLLVDYTIRSA